MSTRSFSLLLFLAVLTLLVPLQARAAEAPLRVLTTIKPLQLIAQAVVGDQAQVEVLLDPRFSPHDYQLKPSDRQKLTRAELVFWVGPGLEVFLERALSAVPSTVAVIALQPAGDFRTDAHIWMDPLAAIEMARQMAEALGKLRPDQSTYWLANAEHLRLQLLALDRDLKVRLAHSATQPGYLVSHDGFGGFERRYGLSHAAAIADGEERPPGPRRMLEIRQLVATGKVACVLLEPQYDRKLVETIAGGRPLRLVAVDTLGEGVAVDVDGAVHFYQNLGKSMQACLGR